MIDFIEGTHCTVLAIEHSALVHVKKKVEMGGTKLGISVPTI